MRDRPGAWAAARGRAALRARASLRGRAAVRRWAALPGRALRLLRRIAGMPDYEAYLAHLRAAHPGCPGASPRRFYEDYLRARYGDGPTRCC